MISRENSIFFRIRELIPVFPERNCLKHTEKDLQKGRGGIYYCKNPFLKNMPNAMKQHLESSVTAAIAGVSGILLITACLIVLNAVPFSALRRI